MQVPYILLTDVPFLKIMAVVLTLWFGYLGAERIIFSHLRKTNQISQHTQRIAQLEQGLRVCRAQLAKVK